MTWIKKITLPFKLLYEIMVGFWLFIGLAISSFFKNKQIRESCLHDWVTKENPISKSRKCSKCRQKEDYNEYYDRWRRRLI